MIVYATIGTSQGVYEQKWQNASGKWRHAMPMVGMLLAAPLRNGPRPTAHVPSQLSAGKRPASRNTCTTVPTEKTCTAAAALFLASSHISNPVILLISCLNGSEES